MDLNNCPVFNFLFQRGNSFTGMEIKYGMLVTKSKKKPGTERG